MKIEMARESARKERIHEYPRHVFDMQHLLSCCPAVLAPQRGVTGSHHFSCTSAAFSARGPRRKSVVSSSEPGWFRARETERGHAGGAGRPAQGTAACRWHVNR